MRRVATVHFLPALVGDLVLLGISGRNRRRRTRRLTVRVVGLHVVDVQIPEGFVFWRNERYGTVPIYKKLIARESIRPPAAFRP